LNLHLRGNYNKYSSEIRK